MAKLNCKDPEAIFQLGIMIGMKDTLEFYKSIPEHLKEDVSKDLDFGEKYYRGLNRLEFENKRISGAKIKKTQKLKAGKYFTNCGNCGNGTIDGNPHWNFCPNCGFSIIRE